MDYNQALKYLFGLKVHGIKPRLGATRSLIDFVGFSFNGLVIHVAGTNGKGSCAATLDSILRHAGYKTGLYTSPELVDFRRG